MAIFFILLVLTVIATLLRDILYTMVDPRNPLKLVLRIFSMTVPAPIDKIKAEAITIEERSPFQVVMKRFVRHRLAMISLAVMVVIFMYHDSWHPILPLIKLMN